MWSTPNNLVWRPRVGRPTRQRVKAKESTMESVLQKTTLVSTFTTTKITAIIYWTSTVLFCLEMSFTAYNELASPQVVAVFSHLGFSSHAFQVELSVAKVLGVLGLLLPFVPARAKE